MLSREERGLVPAHGRLRRERVHRLRARDPRHRLERERRHAALCERLDTRLVRERLEEGDQQLAGAEPLTLVRRRFPYLDDAVRLPRIAERRARLAVGLVGERSGIPGAALDDELEACGRELPYGLGDERDTALALRRLARDSDPHPANSLRTLTHFFTNHGLPLLFAVVMLESFGIPLPGETALIAFGVLASQGHYSIVEVIAVAAAGAIIGDNLGYALIGRLGGRRLFERTRYGRRYADRFLPEAERLMAKHGGKVVFFGRFISILRFTAAWAAGIARMPWWRFLFWNAAGGICWATAVGLVAYYGGAAAADAIQRYGIYAAVAIAAVVLIGFFFTHFGKKWLEKRL